MLSSILKSASGGPLFIGYVSGTDPTDNFSLDISSLDIRAGDLGLFFVGADGGDNQYSVTGFTNIFSILGNSFQGFTKVMNGSETAVVGTGGGADFISLIFVLFRDIDYISVASSSVTDVATGDPNPPAVTVSKGDWVVVVGYQDDDVQPISASPGYTLVVSQQNGISGDGCALAVAYKEDLPAGTEDPGIMSSVNSDTGGAATIVLTPQ